MKHRAIHYRTHAPSVGGSACQRVCVMQRNAVTRFHEDRARSSWIISSNLNPSTLSPQRDTPPCRVCGQPPKSLHAAPPRPIACPLSHHNSMRANTRRRCSSPPSRRPPLARGRAAPSGSSAADGARGEGVAAATGADARPPTPGASRRRPQLRRGVRLIELHVRERPHGGRRRVGEQARPQRLGARVAAAGGRPRRGRRAVASAGSGR